MTQTDTSIYEPLSDTQRRTAQRHAILTQLFATTVIFIVSGQMMQVFSTDVLGLDPKRIGALIGIIPLITLTRFFLLNQIKRFGRVRLIQAGDIARLIVIGLLLFMPVTLIRQFWVYLFLLVAFNLASQLTIGVAWQPILRDITTTHDRGRFFSRMRFSFTVFSMITIGLTTWLVGDQMTVLQYRMLLIIAAVGLISQFYWAGKLPDRPATDSDDQQMALGKLFKVVSQSPAMRLPLVVIMVAALCTVPIMPVYLRLVLNVPAQYIAAWAMLGTVGSAVSFLVWGKVADAIGYRPMFIGLLLINILVAPLYLLVAPLPDRFALFGHAGMSLTLVTTLLAMSSLAIVSGAITAGVGIATTSIQHHYTTRRDAMEVLNVISVAMQIAMAGAAMIGGYILQDWAIPTGTWSFFHGIFWLDGIKIWLIFVIPPAQILLIGLLMKIPNNRPSYGVEDFFITLINRPFRTMVVARKLYHEDEDERLQLARWLGRMPNPIGMATLIELTDDPSYDVKVEAVRSLGLSRADQAGATLKRMLEDDNHQHLSDHIAWALGELQYAPAVPVLIQRLGPDAAARTCAMAARALGRIGDPAAIEPIARAMAQPSTRLHVVSSCARSLVRLRATQHAEAVFDAITLFDNRSERYELLAACADWLQLPSHWLLQSSADQPALASLEQFTADQPKRFGPEHHRIIQAVTERDLQTIRQLLQEQTRTTNLPDDHPIHALAVSINKLDQWRKLVVLAAAWLLFRKP